MNHTQRGTLVALVVLLSAVAARDAVAQFNIHINYAASVTPAQRDIFELAAATWESYITGYQPGISITGVTIQASTPDIEDPEGTDILGLANATAWVNQGGFRLTTAGFMQFDSENVDQLMADGWFDEVVIHEMGHVLGIGINWISNGVYINGSGRYTGQYGVAAYNAEFGQTGDYIPVELSGGPSTANRHWDEVDMGAALTGITDAMGRDLAHELMTGWLNVGRPPYLANFTIQSLRDIGFTVVDLSVVPEPATAALAAPLAAALVWRLRRGASRRGLGGRGPGNKRFHYLSH